jgi:hypothetical protein
MPDSYHYEEILEELDDTYFEGEPITTGPEAESDIQKKLRELYDLPNIGRDEDALRAVIEYGSSENGEHLTLEELEEYAKLFVQFYQDWQAVAEWWLEGHFGEEIQLTYKHMDLPGFGEGIAGDIGGFWGFEEEGRVACFNKKEGQ